MQQPLPVTIKGKMEVVWVWDAWVSRPDGGFCAPKPGDQFILNKPLKELGHYEAREDFFPLTTETKLRAIKVVREHTGRGLKEAMDLVDVMMIQQDAGTHVYSFELVLR